MPAPPEALRRIEEARASGATILDLGDLVMDSLPEELGNLPTLQVLALGRVACQQEGNNLHVSFADTRTSQLFTDLDVLKNLRSLQMLHLCGCESLQNVDGLKNLLRLERLNLSFCTSLQSVNALKNLRRLEWLDLTDCTSLQNVDVLKNLRSLRSLDLYGCMFLTNVDVFKDLRRLKELDLSRCESLQNVDGLKNLLRLERLNLSFCTSLQNVDVLKELRGLHTLNLCWCKSLTDVDVLKELRSLHTLNVSWCEFLTDVNVLKELCGLHTLDLSGCESLTNVDALKELRGLHTLDLSECKSLTNVDALKELRGLHTLDLAYCTALRHFSPLHKLLPQLHELRLYGCRFKDLDPTACGESSTENVLDAVRANYDDSGHGLRRDDEVKVFILGNGGVGKTQLCRRLQGKPFVVNSKSTPGIQVKHIDLALSDRSTSVRLNLWDFGGQDIYYGTHHLFLHEQAVFILLWTPETESGDYVDKETRFRWRQRPLAYWLDYIRSVSRTAPPVLLVQGKCDLNSNHTQLPDSLPEDFASLIPLDFSAKQDEKLQCLRAELKKAVATVLKQPQPEIPTSRVELAQSLRAMLTNASSQPANKRPRTLSLEHFQTLCQENGRISNWREALRSLHHRGVVYWRPDLFLGRIILDQSWALKAIYALFNLARERPRLFQGGRFTRDTLAGVWEKKHTEAAQRTFLSMMQSCGICFRARRLDPGEHPPEWQYIAPELLPEFNTLDVQSQIVAPLPSEPPAARLEVRYGFLHEGVLRRFLSWLGEHVADNAVYWKYGCRFYDSPSGLQMNIDTPPDAWKNGQSGTVTLEAWGEHSAKWLEECLAALQWMSPTQTPDVKRTGFEAHDRVGGNHDDLTPDAIVTRHRAGVGLGRIALSTPGRENKGGTERKWKGCYVLVKFLLKKKPGDIVSQRPLFTHLFAETDEEYALNTIGNYLKSFEKMAKMPIFQWPEPKSGDATTLREGAAEGLNKAKQVIESYLNIELPNWRKQPWAK